MPIRPELRPLYAGKDWQAARARVLLRAGGKFSDQGEYLGGARCEKCNALEGSRYVSMRTAKFVVVQVGIAHLDHEDLARFYDDTNLNCVCRACHLKMDLPIHVAHSRDTRKERKDQARPLFGSAA